MEKRQTTIALSDEAYRLADKIKGIKGISRNAVIELAIRILAQKEGIEVRPVDHGTIQKDT